MAIFRVAPDQTIAQSGVVKWSSRGELTMTETKKYIWSKYS